MLALTVQSASLALVACGRDPVAPPDRKPATNYFVDEGVKRRARASGRDQVVASDSTRFAIDSMSMTIAWIEGDRLWAAPVSP